MKAPQPKRGGHGLQDMLEVRIPESLAGNAGMEAVLRIEWAMLLVRYVLGFALALTYVTAALPLTPVQLALLLAGAAVQNVYTHYVLHTERYGLFTGPLNFTLYLVNICIIVTVTGGEHSPLMALFVILIVGYCLYVPYFHNTFWVTFICCAAYAVSVYLSALTTEAERSYPRIFLDAAVIFLSGALLSALGQVLDSIRRDSDRHAEALATSEAKVRAILDGTGEGIVVIREDGAIIDSNEQACRFLGANRAALQQKLLGSFIEGGHGFLERFRETKRDVYREEANVHGTGRAARKAELAVRAFEQEGQHYYVVVLHDITRHVRNTQASQEAAERLEQLNRELLRSNELRSAYVTALTQRLRSPMAAVLGYCDMLLDSELGSLNEEQRKSIQSCRRSIMRMLGYLDEPFDLAVTQNLAGDGGE